jgi:hypothetical protein
MARTCNGCKRDLEGLKDVVISTRRVGSKTVSTREYCQACDQKADAFVVAAFEPMDDDAELDALLESLKRPAKERSQSADDDDQEQLEQPEADIIPEGDDRLSDAAWQMKNPKRMAEHAAAKLAEISEARERRLAADTAGALEREQQLTEALNTPLGVALSSRGGPF